MELVNLFIKSAFIENMIFTFFLGMCSYLAVSKYTENDSWENPKRVKNIKIVLNKNCIKFYFLMELKKLCQKLIF